MQPNEPIRDMLGDILSDKLLTAVISMSSSDKIALHEIRLRLGRGLTAAVGGTSLFLYSSGELSPYRSDIIITKNDIDHVITSAFEHSVYSKKSSICAGFVTTPKGCRVGFCGEAVTENGRVVNVKNISSVNIRIPREIKGCAKGIYQRIFSDGLHSLLICGPPSCGKTTVLRDLTRLLGGRYPVSLIDERSEIAAAVGGLPFNDVGSFTDVFSSYGRYEGIMTAVRVMSPRVLVCDEIGSGDDVKALDYAAHSGVTVIATAHCGSLEKLPQKPNIALLLERGMFEYAVQLDKGTVTAAERTDKLRCLQLQGV